MSDRQKLFYALLVSVFFHLALGVVLALSSTRHASEMARTPPRPNAVPAALPDLRQLTVTIMPPQAAGPKAAQVLKEARSAPTPMEKPVLDSDGLTRSDKAPDRAVFQSDSNMVAGSKLPATGDAPLPTLEGPKRKFTDFVDRAASFGKGERPEPIKPVKEAATAARPEQKPPEMAKVENSPAEAKATPVASATPLAKAMPVAKASPTAAPSAPPKPAPTAKPDELALGKPTPAATPDFPFPAPTPIQLAKLNAPPALRARPEVAPARQAEVRPPAPPPQDGTMQRETERTRVEGGIGRPGENGVDAVATPFGRYHQKLYNLIGSRWNLYLQEHPKDAGDVTINVYLNTNGKVASTRVVENHALDDLAELSTRAIVESDLPPVPDDLAPMLRSGKLEMSFSFTVYDATHDSPGR